MGSRIVNKDSGNVNITLHLGDEEKKILYALIDTLSSVSFGKVKESNIDRVESKEIFSNMEKSSNNGFDDSGELLLEDEIPSIDLNSTVCNLGEWGDE